MYGTVITFTGSGDGTNWHDELNWDLGIVPGRCQHVIIPMPHDVKIFGGFEGLGLSLDVQPNAKLETLANGKLDIQY